MRVLIKGFRPEPPLPGLTGDEPPDDPVSAPANTLFIVGGTKQSGTTWLYHALCRCPTIWMAPVKELHIHSTSGFRRWRERVLTDTGKAFRTQVLKDKLDENDRRFLDLYRMLPPEESVRSVFDALRACSPQQVFGLVEPRLLYASRKTIDSCLRSTPLDVILFVIRNPVDRALSNLRKNISRISEHDIPREVEKAVNKSRYSIHLQRWLEMAPHRVRLLPYSKLVADSRGFIDDVLSHLGLQGAAFSLIEDRINTGPRVTIAANLQETITSKLASELDYLTALADSGLIETRW